MFKRYIAAATAVAFMVGFPTALGDEYDTILDHANETIPYTDDERRRIAQAIVAHTIESFRMDANSTINMIHNQNPAYQDNEIYMIIINSETGHITAHGLDPSLVGIDTHDLVDVMGTNLGVLLDENKSSYGRWVDYYWPNYYDDPATSVHKSVWVVRDGAHIFIAGIYPGFDTRLDMSSDAFDQARLQAVQDMVDNAIAAFSMDPDLAYAAFQDPHNDVFHDEELYVFVVDNQHVITSHGANEALVGTDTYTLIDTRGTNLGELLYNNTSPYGMWVEYYWSNPVTGNDELKITWIKQHAGYSFAAGIYPQTGYDPAQSPGDQERARIAQAIVAHTIESFRMDANSTINMIHNQNPAYQDNEIYMIIINSETGHITAHGLDPSLVGIDTHDLVDVMGTNLGVLLDENKSSYGRWVDYYWPNYYDDPATSVHKSVWVVRDGAHIFIAGIYPGFDTRLDMSSDAFDQARLQAVQDMVDNAIAAFSMDPDLAYAAFQDPHNDVFHDEELYVFVVDNQHVITSHGANEALVGTDTYTLIDTRGTNLGELLYNNTSPYGMWVEYYWSNPVTGNDELKITWIKQHAGYSFAAGIYP